jgi:hypothetical protein
MVRDDDHTPPPTATDKPQVTREVVYGGTVLTTYNHVETAPYVLRGGSPRRASASAVAKAYRRGAGRSL